MTAASFAPVVDTHAHVYTLDMPLAGSAWHTPPQDAPVERYVETLAAHGVTHAVLSAASLYGDYNDYQIDAVRRFANLRTTVIVKEAAEALARGGEGIGALGELFGASVDRYREASDKWLTGLSVMRAAAERAATGDAQDLLAAYLEQTREVFDHTVQFQRQLFAELRKSHVEVNVDHPVGEAE